MGVDAVTARPERAELTSAASAAADTLTGGAWTAVSRATGVLRVIVIGAVLGPTSFGSTFQFTNSLPNIVYYGFLAGSLVSSLLVPRLVQRLHPVRGTPDPDSAARLAGGFLGVALLGLGVLAPLAVLLAPSVLRLAGPTSAVDTGEQVALAGTLALLLVPQVFCYAIVGTCAAVMHSHRRYALAAAAPAVENVITVGVLLAVGAAYDDVAATGSVPTSELLALGLGCTAAVVLHAALQWWGARRLGVVVRPRAGWRDPEVRAIIRRAMPSMAQAGLVGVQLLAMAGMANRAVGGVVAYQIALNFFFLPIAVCATPAALALLPRLSRPEVLARPALMRDLFVRSTASALFLVVPAAAGYVALSGALADAFSFGRLDTYYGTELVGRSLAAVSLGLVGYTVLLVGTYACYARDDTVSPLRSTVLQTAVCLGLLTLVRRQEGTDVVVAVGLAYACGCSVGAVHLLRTVYRKSAPGDEALAPAVARSLGSAGVMLVLVRLVLSWPDPPDGRAGSLVVCGLGLAVGVASYLGCQRLLRSPELSAVYSGMRQMRHRIATGQP